ncbi:MAG: IMP dehydrogenase [Minicystis sp.]
MAREVNQGRRVVAEVKAFVPPPPERDGRPRRRSILRSFPALDPTAAPPRPFPRREIALAAALGVAALLVAVLARTAALRVALPIALLLGAGFVLRRAGAALRATSDEAPATRRSRSSRSSFSPRRIPRAVHLDGERLIFEGAVTQTLVELGAPFGVTLLASPQRDRLVVMLSSPSGTYHLGAAVDEAARRVAAPLVDRALTVAADDTGLEAIGPDGEPLHLSPDDLAGLVDALVDASPTCLDRFVLTDARGTSLTLDGRVLSIGDRALDLTAPLEWRPIVFQEAFGHAVAVYQGTWVRQGGTEVVLVSLLPQLGPPPGAELDLTQVDRAVLRDLRLMQASPEQPPPAEQRVAIERLFMLPVRFALDRAPRASHQPNRAQA